MSLSQKAVISSLFTYVQFGLALLSGVVLFPLIVTSVGSYSYGLWLATGEAISYVLLGDLGVFTVLPWLIAASAGASDFDNLRQHLSNAFVIGCALGLLLLLAAGVLIYTTRTTLSPNISQINEVVASVALLLLLNGLCYPFRVANAYLTGVQDIYFTGGLAVCLNVMTIVLTVAMVLGGTGIFGLAIATGLPPLIGGAASAIRMWFRHSIIFHDVRRPTYGGCCKLFREGFAGWLGGLGFRLMTASNGIVFSLTGHPEWGTVFASTNKIAQILSPLCSTMPDSGLIGLGHVYAAGDHVRTHRSVVCLLLLYLVLPSFAAIGLLILNSVFVDWWIGPELFAGSYVNTLMAANLVASVVAGGCLKLVCVVGNRHVVGCTTLIAGIVYAVLGFCMVRVREIAGLAETSLIVSLLVVLPVGGQLITRVFGVRYRELSQYGMGRWLAISIPMLIAACVIGVYVRGSMAIAITVSVVVICLYGFLLRSVLSEVPWPIRVRFWLARLSIIPKVA